MAEETEDLTSYKLIYFPVKALAEPIRYLLNYGKINFEDVRLERAKFQTLKDGQNNFISELISNKNKQCPLTIVNIL